MFSEVNKILQSFPVNVTIPQGSQIFFSSLKNIIQSKEENNFEKIIWDESEISPPIESKITNSELIYVDDDESKNFSFIFNNNYFKNAL